METISKSPVILVSSVEANHELSALSVMVNKTVSELYSVPYPGQRVGAGAWQGRVGAGAWQSRFLNGSICEVGLCKLGFQKFISVFFEHVLFVYLYWGKFSDMKTCPKVIETTCPRLTF